MHILGHINNINEAIQFTVDSENENGELPFLDCLSMRNSDGTLDTTVYRKPTNAGRYLNFHSCHSSATKQGFIKGLFLRAERLCSTPDLLKTEMERIYSELLNNSYPKKFIDREKTRIPNQAPLERNWTSTVCIPYVPKSQKRAEERSIRKVSSGIRLYKHSGEIANSR